MYKKMQTCKHAITNNDTSIESHNQDNHSTLQIGKHILESKCLQSPYQNQNINMLAHI